MHYWLDGKGLTDLTIDELKAAPQLTTGDVIHLTKMLTDWVNGNEDQGLKLHTASGGRVRNRELHAEEIASPTSGLRIMDKEMPQLVQAMQAINLDDPQIDYDKFIALQRALCAATGCDIKFLHEIVWP